MQPIPFLKSIIVFAFLFLFCGTSEISNASGRKETGPAGSEKKQYAISCNLSERYIKGYAKDTALLNTYAFDRCSIPQYSEEVYRQRIEALPASIALTYNSHVKQWIDIYLVNKRWMITKVIGRSYDHFPLFEEVLARKGMPEELKNLAVVESALDTNALSRCGALGLWQFMPETAKIYKLKVGKNIDERTDPARSTEAATKFLGDLYKRYGDWLLAIAAYNCGPGKVDQALRVTTLRPGQKKDFWAIMDKLPKETRGYVPAFIAACYIDKHYADHNLKAVDPFFLSTEIKQIEVKQEIDLLQIARYVSATPEEIAYFNPRFEKAGKVLLTNGTAILNLPACLADEFTRHEAIIFCNGIEEIAEK
jgi:membrane-bound lytic murein transglycosylase D